MTLRLFLQALALVFLVLAAVRVPDQQRLAWGWAGLAIWLMADAFGSLRF